MLRRLLAALVLLAPAPALQAQGQPVTVFVVRHAEKGPGNPDPSLNEAGQRRAEELARVLSDAHPTVLFATEFKRTQETLAPVVKATGLIPMIIGAAKMDELIAAVNALPAGSVVVVASHSNLVPVIVKRLSGQTIADLTDADYDRLVVVTLSGDGRSPAMVLRYGAP